MQAIELAMGELPREYDSWDEVHGWHRGLLPTPRPQTGGGGGYPDYRDRPNGVNLATAVDQLLPTPMTSYTARTAEEWRDGRPAGNGARRERIGDLGLVAEKLLPTPVAHDDGKTPEAHRAMKARMGHGRKAITSLGVVAQTLPLLPTPKANDGKGATITHGRTRPDGRPYGNGDANLPLRVVELLPTPVAGEARHGSPNQHRTRGDTMLTGEILGLLPDAELTDRREELLRTPGGYAGDRGGAQSAAKRKEGGHSVNLEDQVHDLLPTPSVSDGSGGHINRSGDRKDELLLGGLAQTLEVEWGAYEPAIRRWEALCGVPAPSPVEPGQRGRPRLSPAFVEWMMGLPAGWVTEVEGLSRAKQLKLLGNGVVPQQVVHALRVLCAKLTMAE